MPDSDSEWKYELDDVGEDAEAEAEIEDFDLSVHPGSPSAENAFFVALGALTMLALFGRLVLLAV
ncbi:DUF7312 domain-containing protein [Halorussus marinus]|uniref:DUF7312 domain-containing protein n=1 Tax=Halorussus marinus TaxID=2505976 RepID=UPI00106E5EEA|nr:hypothetical protein [Halorussus marinus]